MFSIVNIFWVVQTNKKMKKTFKKRNKCGSLKSQTNVVGCVM